MLLLFVGEILPAKVLFAPSLGAMLVSLALSLREVQVSIQALSYLLSDLEQV